MMAFASSSVLTPQFLGRRDLGDLVVITLFQDIVAELALEEALHEHLADRLVLILGDDGFHFGIVLELLATALFDHQSDVDQAVDQLGKQLVYLGAILRRQRLGRGDDIGALQGFAVHHGNHRVAGRGAGGGRGGGCGRGLRQGRGRAEQQGDATGGEPQEQGIHDRFLVRDARAAIWREVRFGTSVLALHQPQEAVNGGAP